MKLQTLILIAAAILLTPGLGAQEATQLGAQEATQLGAQEAPRLGAQEAQRSEAALQMLRENPNRAGANIHVYEFIPEKDTPAPKGYKPVYLAYYARHGARNNGDTRSYEYVIKYLEKADSAGILNSEGLYLLEKTREVLAEFDGMPGHLTRRGEYEHRELARRLYKRNKAIFRKGSKNIRVESTTVPRTLVSMACCVSELSSIQKDLNFNINTGEKYSILGNNCSKAQKAATQVLLDSLRKHTSSDNESIYRTLFTDPAVAKTIITNPGRFQRHIFNTAAISESVGVADDLWRLLPEDVIYRQWDLHNRSLYIRQCNSVEYGDQRMKKTEPLVKEIVSHADEALSGGKMAADLYFGHDFPAMAVAAYFALEGPGDRLTFDEIPFGYCNPRWVCFAMNIQWIFYRGRKGDVLCKIVFNGEEMHIRGLKAVSEYYYRWEDIKGILPCIANPAA